MNIRNRCTKVCLFLWVLGMCFAAHPLHAQSVIPVPLKIEQGTGSFLLSEKTKLYTNIQGGEARLLESYLQALPVHLKKGKKKDTQNVLSLLITEKSEQLPSPESYTLSVTPERILIRATSGAGLFYGIQTLLQLSQPSGTGYSIASVEVQDSPRFAYRGLMLDVSRHCTLQMRQAGELKSRNILCLQNLQPGVLTPIGRRGGTADVSTSVSTSLELPEVTIHRMIFAKS